MSQEKSQDDFLLYEQEKQKIAREAKNQCEYEQKIKALAERLKL